MALKALHSPCRTIVLAIGAKSVRPTLHPMMGIVPISARVALQLTAREYRRSDPSIKSPGQCARVALMHLPLGIDGIIRLALHSLGAYLDLGYSSSEWLQTVLEASHFGHSFRRCFFFDYKANRSPYPRVTNRGVRNSLESSPNHNQIALLDD
jgi:hypothetical protein